MTIPGQSSIVISNNFNNVRPARSEGSACDGAFFSCRFQVVLDPDHGPGQLNMHDCLTVLQNIDYPGEQVDPILLSAAVLPQSVYFG
jgi:hypothetical protein